MILESASVKFQLIHNMLESEDCSMSITEMCSLAGVSRGGYYYWCNQEEARRQREQADLEDFSLVLEAYKFRGYAKGARSIYMRLLHLTPPVVMNIKKIRRLMDKYNLRCPIRKPNPYRRMLKAIRTNNFADNILKRRFKDFGPRKVLLTDITYIPFSGEWLYLSVIIDAYTKQVLSYVLSDTMKLDFVLETVKQLLEKYGVDLSQETMIHSDQGVHYTSCKFIEIVENAELRRSMSRRGNCWDNAPQESFFGHMKQEIDLSNCRKYSEVKAAIDDWMAYYNQDRYQWNLAKLSPNEYYDYIKTKTYPL